jgi:hypothetical protein
MVAMNDAPSGVESDEIIASLQRRGYLAALPSVDELAAADRRELEGPRQVEPATEYPDVDQVGEQEPTTARVLRVRFIREVLAELAALGNRPWLVRGLWPGDSYGVLGAEDKAGKTWALLDLAVSVAAGVPWFGRFECPHPGPVTMFLGEGGMVGMVRRFQAVSAHKGVNLAGLPLRLEFKAPNLTHREHLNFIAKELADHPPRLVALDPFYLSAGGRSGANLNEMGEVLAQIQAVAENVGAALAIVVHWNKTGTGRGPERFTGVGPGAWGRVLGSAAVEQAHVDEASRASTVTLAWTFRGGEIPGTEFRTRRKVWSDDPEDLDAPMHYQVEVTGEGPTSADPNNQLGPGKQRLLALLCQAAEFRTSRQLQDATARDGAGSPLQLKTVKNLMGDLEKHGLVQGTEPIPGYGRHWTLTPAGEDAIGGCR